MISMLVRSLTVVGLSLFLAATVRAEERHGPCHDDVQKLCKGIERGEGRLAKCLHENEQKLSQGCRQKMAEMKKHMEKEWEACRADREKLCKDVQPGEGRIIRCFKGHENELSGACKAKLKEMHERNARHMERKGSEGGTR